jgi:hypothetical protein
MLRMHMRPQLVLVEGGAVSRRETVATAAIPMAFNSLGYGRFGEEVPRPQRPVSAILRGWHPYRAPAPMPLRVTLARSLGAIDAKLRQMIGGR